MEADARGSKISVFRAYFRGGAGDRARAKELLAELNKIAPDRIELEDIGRQAAGLIRNQWRAVDALATQLVERGSISGEQAERLCGPLLSPPWVFQRRWLNE